jgi:hypothetical protein
MWGRLSYCRELQLSWAGLWSGPLTFDGTAVVQAVAGMLLGVARVRLVPIILLAVGWEVAEALVDSCAPLGFLAPVRELLRPAPGDVLSTLGGWMLGRLVRWSDRRRSEARLLATAEAEADEAWQNVVATALPPPSMADIPAVEGGTQLELDDEEAAVLRGAVDARLTDLKRASQDPERRGFSAELWERIGVLESLLARLPPSRHTRWGTAS